MAKIVVLATGGTIAGQAASAYDAVGYTAGQLGVDALLADVPGLSVALQGHAIESEQVAQLDSKDMTDATWQTLAQRCIHWLEQEDVAGLVITHGTDTLEETAYFLWCALKAACAAGALPEAAMRKPVVLACAMRPATARMPDGPQNLLDAVAVVLDQSAQGVMAVCAGCVHGAMDVTKVHPYRLDAFASGDAGVLAYVEEAKVRWVRQAAAGVTHAVTQRCHLEPANESGTASLWQALHQVDAAGWPWVEVVSSHAGARADGLHALVKAGVQGLVLAGTGNATLHHALERAAVSIMQSGVAVWRTSRCGAGHVVPGHASQVPLALDGAYVLSPQKARVALMLHILQKGE